ncbi:hypothetical protein EBR21_04490 [bacterium]|nr:hypothetical protein [bacterium]
MFTQGTKQFGIWRTGHPSVARHTGRPTQAILLAYGFCAFLTWLIFILTLKIRGDFFLVESMEFPLHKVTAESFSPQPATPVGLTLAVRRANETGSMRIVFDSGEAFLWPAQSAMVEQFLRNRVDDIELSALLRKRVSPGIGTADLWVDAQVPMSLVQPFARILVDLGFDTLRYAVDTGGSGRRESH